MFILESESSKSEVRRENPHDGRRYVRTKANDRIHYPANPQTGREDRREYSAFFVRTGGLAGFGGFVSEAGRLDAFAHLTGDGATERFGDGHNNVRDGAARGKTTEVTLRNSATVSGRHGFRRAAKKQHKRAFNNFK